MNDKPNFFDGKTLGAIALVFAVWMGWQYYMQKRYPAHFAKKPATVADNIKTDKSAPAANSSVPVEAVNQAELKPSSPAVQAKEEKVLVFESPSLSFDLSSKGMGLRNIHLKKYTNRAGAVVSLGSTNPDQLTFETKLIGHADSLYFDVEKLSDTVFLGHAKWGGITITKKMEVFASRYEIKTSIEASGVDRAFIGLSNILYDQALPIKSGGFFVPQFDIQEFFVANADTTTRVHFPKENLDQSFSKLNLVSLGNQYFAQAYVNRSETFPELKIDVIHGSHSSAQISYQVLNRDQPLSISYSGFLGPKDVALLKSVEPDLAGVVDFGFFSWIAKYILVLLKWFYALVGNWGWAIILLTIAVRILVLPFNIMSYKSMKVMQVLQPQMKAIREKYKDDQQKMNLEIMALLKNNRANPLGGCLPVLLQFPIFLALYQVLGHSIELYQAPFGFWIHDLSAKDPYYVLPVLMGLTLFVQQKITPNTMDPAQARILLFMPILFSFFMLALPSGLTLYIFVSGLFGVAQQYYFMKFNQVDTPVKVK